MSQGFDGWNNFDGSGYAPSQNPGFNPRGQRSQQMPQQAPPWTRGILPPSQHRLGGGQNLGPYPFDPSQGPNPFGDPSGGGGLSGYFGAQSNRGAFNPRGQGQGSMQGGMGEGGPFGGNAIQALRPSSNPNFNPRGMRTPGGQQGGPFGGNALSMLRPGSSAGSMAQGGPFSGAKNIANLMPGGGSGGGFMSKLGGLGKKIGGMSTMGKVGLGMGGLGAAKLAGGYMKKRKAQKAGARQRDQQAQMAQMGQPQQMRGPMF